MREKRQILSGERMNVDRQGGEMAQYYRPEVYNPQRLSWEKIKQEIVAIELSAFSAEDAFDAETLEADFKDPESVIILMRDSRAGRLVGFTYAKSTLNTYPEEYPERPAAADTAYVYDTAIAKSYRKRGLLRPLLLELDKELVRA